MVLCAIFLGIFFGIIGMQRGLYGIDTNTVELETSLVIRCGHFRQCAVLHTVVRRTAVRDRIKRISQVHFNRILDSSNLVGIGFGSTDNVVVINREQLGNLSHVTACRFVILTVAFSICRSMETVEVRNALELPRLVKDSVIYISHIIAEGIAP